ncbi:protein-export chaperone SecB [Altericroceibacterium xinjiangense]|uniref:protein-export chaperone SecB n=1 Tax=Altericroceibacterium xinjiangense TaxID=762261 RepID=UPI000F7E35FE|nr:protein-export chaperone SecB [Altericroceibacterium xinjiangense]
MADQGDTPDLTNASNGAMGGNGADTQPVAGVITQYIKDLSVENPKAPESFQWQDQPQLDVQFNIGARAVNQEVSEIELKISVNAKGQAGSFYIVELAYCGLVGMRNMTEDQKHAFMYAEGPRLLFPFARRVVADATRDAGFAPLVLDPIDFNGIYLQNLQNRQAESDTSIFGGEG